MNQTAKREEAPTMLFGENSGWKIILIGLVVSIFTATIFYLPSYWVILAAFESHLLAKVLALVCAISVVFEMWVRKIDRVKVEHRGVVEFFGKIIPKILPVGDIWLPPFCKKNDVNIGEQTIDMRDTEVYVKQSKKATLHLQAQVVTINPYAYALKLASMQKISEAEKYDAVIQAMIGKIKSATRIFCEENLANLDELNQKKVDLIRSITDNSVLKNEFAEWGLEIRGLVIRTVILPDELVLAANAVEIEERQRQAETKDVQTLVRIGNIIKNGYTEESSDGTKTVFEGFGVSGNAQLEAAQLQQKRITGTVVRGRGLAIVNDKDQK